MIDLDAKTLFLSEQPLLDVRAPVEFTKGSFPSATNIPILDDQQRHDVGVCYKNSGAKAAEQLGHQLLSATKDELIAKWQAYITKHPDALLYCYRWGSTFANCPAMVKRGWYGD